jgi:c-di-GMP-binding flagellar brake protein YcgR
MKTTPASPELPAAASAEALGDFRITSPREILAMLRMLQDSGVTLNLSAANGAAVTATLWTLDPARGAISLSAEADNPQLQSLVDCDEAVVVGYLDSVKLQFDVQNLLLLRGPKGSALSCAFPREMFRFQRRSSYRVRPLLRSSPMAQFRHPMIGDMQLSLRILDMSLTGCALFLPDDIPPLEPGILINDVLIVLDLDTRFHAALRLHHVTGINPESKGVRLGCEVVNLASDAERALQRYIDQNQKRRRLMTRG